MSPIPVQVPLLWFVSAGLLVGTLLVMTLTRLSPAQAGWCAGGWRALGQGIGWGLLLAAAGAGWLRFLIHTGNYLPVPVVPSPVDICALVLVVPLTEELFYRGIIFGSLQRTWHPLWAIFFTAVIYVLGHHAEPWVAFLLLTSTGYALAFRLSASILAPMLAHVLVALVMLLARVSPDAVADLPLKPLLLLAGCAGVLILVSGVGRKSKAV